MAHTISFSRIVVLLITLLVFSCNFETNISDINIVKTKFCNKMKEFSNELFDNFHRISQNQSWMIFTI